MARGPPPVPDSYDRVIEYNLPRGLPTVVSLLLFAISCYIIYPQVMMGYTSNPGALASDLADFDSIHQTIAIIVSFLFTAESHEQSHRIFAYFVGLDPEYRRTGTYVVPIQEEFYSREKALIMTSAPILCISVPSVILAVLSPFELISGLSGLIFILNSSMISKDCLDIVYALFLPEGSLYWVSDLGETGETYIALPDA
jgi:hypothetical protein